MPLAPGRALSHYRLVAPIGEGGMGVVWRATDSTLGRDVAIKVLPDLFAADPERMARFEREAKLLAALNHPHIASIYGLHSADGVRFLAMELVEGEDLAQRLSHGAIPVAEALPIALEVAQALEHAHERGVIHRDLKPANVKLTRDGKAKVLDFGLAKALEGEGPGGTSAASPSESPTITGPMTGANVLLGTAAYMSPEQARGHAADRRADIWAFGVLVMEMLTGRRVFEGGTISDTLASVLKSDPDWAALPRDTPPRLRALLQRCLERNPRQRLRDIGEARIALEEMIAAPNAEPENAPARSRVWAPALAIAGALVGVVAMLVTARAVRPAAPGAPLRKFRLALPAGASAAPAWPAISPDGREVAYVCNGAVWVQSLRESDPRELKTDPDPSHLFWSADSRFLGYVSGTRILKLAMEGGESQVICDAGDMTGAAAASWGSDGVITFSRADSSGIFRVPAVGGDPKSWLRPDASENDLHQPFALPGGRGVVFIAHRIRGGLGNITLWSGGRRKTLLELPEQVLAYPVYDPAGYILFGRGPTTPGVWALPFSLARLEATGPPFLVVPDGANASVSAAGTLVCLTANATGARQLAIWDRAGKEQAVVGEPEASMGSPDLSPDGKRVAWPINVGLTSALWIFDTSRGTRSRVTFDPRFYDAPSWVPPGNRIVYSRTAVAGGPPASYAILAGAADGTGLTDSLALGVVPNVEPDGKHITYTGLDKIGAVSNVMEVPLDGPHVPRLLVAGMPRATGGRVSPAGNFLAYMSQESGQWEVFLTRYPTCEGRWQVSNAGGQWPRWNGKGDRLYYEQGADVVEVEVGGTTVPMLGTPKRLFATPALSRGLLGFTMPFSVTADGSRFLIVRPAGQQGALQGVTLVQNWAAEFAKAP